MIFREYGQNLPGYKEKKNAKKVEQQLSSTTGEKITHSDKQRGNTEGLLTVTLQVRREETGINVRS